MTLLYVNYFETVFFLLLLFYFALFIRELRGLYIDNNQFYG